MSAQTKKISKRRRRPRAVACLGPDITDPANWRSVRHYDEWLRSNGLSGIAGVDTRQLTRRIRDLGTPHATICNAPNGQFDIPALQAQAADWPGLEGMDLAKDVSCRQTYNWDETNWVLGQGYGKQTDPKFHVVAVDFGAKRNILRALPASAVGDGGAGQCDGGRRTSGTNRMESFSRTGQVIPPRPANTPCL